MELSTQAPFQSLIPPLHIGFFLPYEGSYGKFRISQNLLEEWKAPKTRHMLSQKMVQVLTLWKKRLLIFGVHF